MESGIRNLAFVIANSKSPASVTSPSTRDLPSIQPSSLSCLARQLVPSATTPHSSSVAQSSQLSEPASSTLSTRRPRLASGSAIRSLLVSALAYASKHPSWLGKLFLIPKTYPPPLLSYSSSRPSAEHSWFPVLKLGSQIHC